MLKFHVLKTYGIPENNKITVCGRTIRTRLLQRPILQQKPIRLGGCFFKFYFDHSRVDLAPAKSCVRKWVKKFKNPTQRSLTRRQTGRNCNVRAEETIQKVKQSSKSLMRRRGQCLGLKRTSLHTILRKFAPTPLHNSNMSKYNAI